VHNASCARAGSLVCCTRQNKTLTKKMRKENLWPNKCGKQVRDFVKSVVSVCWKKSVKYTSFKPGEKERRLLKLWEWTRWTDMSTNKSKPYQLSHIASGQERIEGSLYTAVNTCSWSMLTASLTAGLTLDHVTAAKWASAAVEDFPVV